MPVLITEAGHLDTGDEEEIARFYQQAFRDWMADPKVIAATPLFWHPDRNDFWMFELDKKGAFVHKSPTYELMRRLPRVAGSPSYAVTLANSERTTPYEVLVAEEEPAEDAEAAEGEDAVTSDRLGDNWELEGRGSVAAARAREPKPGSAPRDGSAAAATRPALTPQGQAGTAANARATTTMVLAMRVTNTDGAGARLRAEPSRDADSIAILPDGTVVQALGQEREIADVSWQKVRADDGVEGWVVAELLAPAGGD
jgi:hypothetical protein